MKLNKNKKGKQELHPSNFKRSFVKFISYINEFFAVIAAKKGFELAGEIQKAQKDI